MRTVIALVLAALCGGALGAGVMGVQAQAAKAQAEQTVADLQNRHDALRAERQALEDRLDALLAQTSAPALTPAEGDDRDAAAEDLFEAVPMTEPQSPVGLDTAASLLAGQAALSELERRRDREEQRREEWSERRSEFRDRFETGMNEFFDGQMAKAGDAAEQQRLMALQDQVTYGMDLMRAYRQAESDEDRDALRAEMETAFAGAQSLVLDQQDALLRRSLAAQGITDTAQQDALVQSLKESLNDPFFRMPPEGGSMWSVMGGFGGRGDGFRGRGRGGSD